MTREEAIKEFNRRMFAQEYVVPEQLKSVSIADITSFEEFKNNLSALMCQQADDRAKYKELTMAIYGGTKTNYREPVDAIIEKGLIDDVNAFISEYRLIMDKKSQLSTRERTYILQLGNLALRTTMRNIILTENKDLQVLYNQANNIN